MYTLNTLMFTLFTRLLLFDFRLMFVVTYPKITRLLPTCIYLHEVTGIEYLF